MDFPKVAFGIIVLNGEPFLRYNLRALYPFAHQIIVVEGAVPAASAIATPDGHSSDGTLDVLSDFKANEDSADKLTIVTAENHGYPDGFWPGEKHEQSQAYATRATGDYLWQVDIDEFYQPKDMLAVLRMLKDQPDITAVSFKMSTFWGGFDYITDGWYLRRGADVFHRLFKWEQGYRYVTHRPPTVHDSQGRDLRSIKWIQGHNLERRGIMLYHYSLVFPKQVTEKCEYYSAAAWTRRQEAQQWARRVFMALQNPYRVHNVYKYPSWLERFTGQHPPQIEELRRDLQRGELNVAVRATEDMEALLMSWRYRFGRTILKLLDRVERRWGGQWRRGQRRLSRVLRDPAGSAAILQQKVSRFLNGRS